MCLNSIYFILWCWISNLDTFFYDTLMCKFTMLNLLNCFRFDDRSLYFEQKFVSLHDNFIRAIALCKNTAVNCDVITAMKEKFDLNQPECPEDLAKFIESNDISSNKLKMTGHPVSVATSLSSMDKKMFWKFNSIQIDTTLTTIVLAITKNYKFQSVSIFKSTKTNSLKYSLIFCFGNLQITLPKKAD